MPSVTVELYIEPEEFVRLYEGSARTVVARAEDGRTISFPARILRPYVTGDGVRGRFRIEFGSDNRYRSIERI